MSLALLPAALVSGQAVDVAPRLERLVERLETHRRDVNIPGLAVAVVKDDEIVLARGFGLANIEEGRPVDEETLFAVGSTTKAFTATLIGMLVDEGAMAWDDPVTKHLPEVRLGVESDDPAAEVTIRDLLCHRTGFGPMNVLWAAGRATPDEVFRAAGRAEPLAPFRREFHYNNVMYLVAGTAAAAASRSTWDELLAARLLEPLGMTSSNTSIRQSQRDERLALGYRWEPDRQQHVHLPMRVLDTIAPAGAINSNVLDMAQWIRFQLGRGVHDGRRLISEDTHRETWTPQMPMGTGVHYGFGWMRRQWNGQPIIEHGGGIDGFAATVALLPESDLGCVILANGTGVPLPAEMVWDAILGEADGPGQDEPAEVPADLAAYLGRYVADFAAFKDERFTVLTQNDRLAVDVPGQMVYELEPPDDEGQWAFAVAQAIKVSFDRDEEGAVVGMTLHQAGLEFELPREGVVREPEVPLDTLVPYLGRYRHEALAAIVEVLVRNNRLAVDVPGQMVYELEPPDEEGRWRFAVTDTISVTFERDGAGVVEFMTIDQAGVEFRLPKIAEPAEPDAILPTAEEIAVLRDHGRRRAAVAAMGATRLHGTIRLVHAGVDGRLEVTFSGLDRLRHDTDLGVFGDSHIVIDGDVGWRDSAFERSVELEGASLAQARQSHPALLFGDLSEFFDTIDVLRAERRDDRRVYVLELGAGDLPPVTATMDAESGDLLEVESITLLPGGGRLPVTTSLGDFREVSGVRVPFLITTENAAVGRSRIEITELRTDLELDAGVFRRTGPTETPEPD